MFHRGQMFIEGYVISTQAQYKKNESGISECEGIVTDQVMRQEDGHTFLIQNSSEDMSWDSHQNSRISIESDLVLDNIEPDDSQGCGGAMCLWHATSDLFRSKEVYYPSTRASESICDDDDLQSMMNKGVGVGIEKTVLSRESTDESRDVKEKYIQDMVLSMSSDASNLKSLRSIVMEEGLEGGIVNKIISRESIDSIEIIESIDENPDVKDKASESTTEVYLMGTRMKPMYTYDIDITSVSDEIPELLPFPSVLSHEHIVGSFELIHVPTSTSNQLMNMTDLIQSFD